jgi:hypothetical protein
MTATSVTTLSHERMANRFFASLIPRDVCDHFPTLTTRSVRSMSRSKLVTRVLSMVALCVALVGCSSISEYATALSNQGAWAGAAGEAVRNGPTQFDALLSLAGKSFVSSDSRLDILSEDVGDTLVLIHSRADQPRSGMPWKMRRGPPNGHLTLLAHGLQWSASYYHARILPSGDLLLGWITESGEVRGFTYRVQPDGSVYRRSVGDIKLDGTFTDSAAYGSNYQLERAGMATQAAANMRARESAEAQRKREEQAESEARSAAAFRAFEAGLAEARGREAASRAAMPTAAARQQQTTPALTGRTNSNPSATQPQVATPPAVIAPAPQATAAAVRVAAPTTNANAQKQQPPAAASTLDDPSGCVSAPEPMKHPNCKDGTAFGVRNSCAQAVDVRMCIKTTAGRWDCGASPTVNPGGSWSYPSCAGTSTVWTDARSAGPRARRFNDPP